MAATLTVIATTCFAPAALHRPGQFTLAQAGRAVRGLVVVAVTALPAALGGALLITMSNRETPVRREQPGTTSMVDVGA